MKRQCNLCGLRIDTIELAQKGSTWCPVYDKEVENKHSGCEYWRPDASPINGDKVQIAAEIKKTIQSQSDQKKKKVGVSKTGDKRHCTPLVGFVGQKAH